MSVIKNKNKRIIVAVLIVAGLVIAAVVSYFIAIFVVKVLNTPLGLTIYKSVYSLEDFEINGFAGTGTDEDPFMIENEIIDAEYHIGIYISGVEASITIRNCTFSSQIDNGIDLDGISGNVSIHNNTFLCKSGSLFISDVTNSYIYDNYFSKSVSVYDSNNPVIENNIFDMEKEDAFYIDNTPNASIANNKFYNCGMRIFESNITIFQSWVMDNNKVNELPILFLTGVENSTLNSGKYGQIIGVDCQNITLTCFEIENSGRAIDLISSQNCTVKNNIIKNSSVGIGAYHGSDITILNNSCIDCNYGIDSTYAARTIIQDNECINCEYGISVQGYSNTQEKASTIIHNFVDRGKYCGIYITSNYCQIKFNIVREIGQHGIAVIGDNNSIHHNSLIDNNYGGESQARDTGEDNVWYDVSTLEGNFWSDWSGYGTYSIEGSAENEDIYPMRVEGEKKLGVGVVIVISLSSVFGLGVLIIVIYFSLKRRKENKYKE